LVKADQLLLNQIWTFQLVLFNNDIVAAKTLLTLVSFVGFRGCTWHPSLIYLDMLPLKNRWLLRPGDEDDTFRVALLSVAYGWDKSKRFCLDDIVKSLVWLPYQMPLVLGSQIIFLEVG